MSDQRFLVQCISGKDSHVMETVPGSQLEAECKKRADAGFLDALCLGTDSCPECVEESREQARRDENLLALLGCPIGGFDGCEDNCPCKTLDVIPDSRYAGQTQRISQAA